MTLAMVFPGQGSQTVGMLSQMATHYRQVEQTFSEASKVLDYDLWQLVSQGSADQLNLTEHAQPALLTASIALWRIWQDNQGAAPSLFAGHSLGEYSALCCAEVIDFATAVSLVAARGRYMQAAVAPGEGAMAAIIGLDNDVVEKVCATHSEGQVLVAANYNAPGQVVIAGHADAVQRGMEAAKAAGAKLVKLLPVSVPSHCQLMTQAADHMAGRIKDTVMKQPAIPVVNNVDATVVSDEDAIKQALLRQLCGAVRWTQSMAYFAAEGDPASHRMWA